MAFVKKMFGSDQSEREFTPFSDESKGLISGDGDDESINSSGHGGHKKTTTLGAIFNFVCVTVGAGILSLPGALKEAGWFGILFFILIAAASNFTAKMLIACMHAVPGRRLTTYEEIGEAVWGRAGAIIVSIFQVFQLFGVCVIFLIIIGGNMASIVNSPCITYHDWILITVFVLLPFTWLKTMREISFLAFFGLLASFIVAITVVIVGLYQTIENADNGLIDIHQGFTSTKGVISSIDIAIFSFGVHSVLPTVENSMERPKDFPMVSNVSFFIITEIYCLVAIAGYAAWGNLLDSSGNILDSMSADYGRDGFLGSLVIAVTVIITAHVVCAFPLPMNPINLALEKALNFDKLPPKKELVLRICLRSSVMAAAVLVASVVPYFGDVIGFISAIAGTVVAFILPVVFYYLLNKKYGDQPIPRGTLIIMGIVFLLGLASFGLGMYFSTESLIDDIQASPNPFANFFRAAGCDGSSSGSTSSSS